MFVSTEVPLKRQIILSTWTDETFPGFADYPVSCMNIIPGYKKYLFLITIN